MILFGIIGCMGLDQETNISELRIVAIQSEPAEIALSDFSMAPMSMAEQPNQGAERIDIPVADTEPDDPVSQEPVANILIADPLKEGYQYAVWQCTNLGDGCLEAELFEDELSAWISIGETTEQELQIPIQLNPVWFGLLDSPELTQPVSFTGLWVLACAPETCDVLSRALQGEWDRSAFANPFELMVSVPIEKTSLGFRSLYVSQVADEELRLKNPIITPKNDQEIITSLEKPAELQFDLTLFQRDPETASIYGYATIGGFDSNSLANNLLDALVLEKSLNWYVSEEDNGGESSLFVVVNDGLGGVSYWTGAASVQ